MSTTTLAPRALVHRTVGSVLQGRDRLRRFLDQRPARGERGLSQSTEQALLVAGAVTVGGLIAAAVIAFVTAKLAEKGL
ncbi:MAG: hypothetical protein Q4F65_10760 [Propionibacteriaceae bacterium]|nr:hypothetical protein [Propionibacteriaceae bacterium]